MFDRERYAIIRRLNKTVKFSLDNPISLRLPKLDLSSTHIVGFSDASFANNRYLTVQLGHVVFLTDSKNNSVPIAFKSYKARRIVQSAMAGEYIAFSNMFDIAITLATKLENIYERKFPVHLITNSKHSLMLYPKARTPPRNS